MAFDTFERMVAFRYLRARRQEGFISVIAIFSLLGIMLGVATLIIVMSVMNGFRAELLHEILGINGHLGVFSAQGRIPDFAAQALLASHIGKEALQAFGDDNVLVGSKLAFKLGIRPGGQITLLSPLGSATSFGNVPRVKTYHVGGTFEIGMYEYDSSFVFMPMAAAQLFFQVPDAATSLEVFVDDPDQARTIGYSIYRLLGDKYRVYDWQQSNSAILGAVEIERDVMFIILSLIVLVAAFNIISSMIMLVKDKGSDIAILRTMGATRGMILRIFILSGASIGIVGTVLGF